MKKHLVILPFLALTLCSCVKTEELFPADAYCHPEFDLNYYTEWNGVDSLMINEQIVRTTYPNSESGLSKEMIDLAGETKLSLNNSSFAYGYLSKLYDGRISCGGLYQKSRVQLNKTGYATFFPKQLKDNQYFYMALRGGTTCSSPLRSMINVDYEISFYIHITNSNSYNKVVYQLNNVATMTDYGGDTVVLSFPLVQDIENAVAMSFTYKLNDTKHPEITDDYTDNEKDHFAIMLYEILLPGSTWY